MVLQITLKGGRVQQVYTSSYTIQKQKDGYMTLECTPAPLRAIEVFKDVEQVVTTADARFEK